MNEISVDRLVNSIVRDYDKNRNGQLELNKRENFFDERTSHYEGDKYIVEINRYSFDSLFKAADVNGDDIVTKDEITNVVKQFDKDNNGKLTARSFWDWVSGKPKGEYDVFSENHPESKRLLHREVHYRPGHPGQPRPFGDFPEDPRLKNLG